MGKPQARRIPSDDCAVPDGDSACYPHEGETVAIVGRQTVAEWQAFEGIRRLGVDLLAAQGEPDEVARILLRLNGHFDELCTLLAERVVDWDWTDNRGRPLPKPDGTAAPLKRLSSDELGYLVMVATGESPGQRKNGSPPSPITSSATGSLATGAPSSTTGRSPSRAP